MKVYPQFNHIIDYRLAKYFHSYGLHKLSEIIAAEVYGKNGIQLDIDSEIGEGLLIENNVTIGSGVKVGSNVTLHQGVSIRNI